MIDELARQAGLILSDQRDAIFPKNIFRRYDHKFIPGNSRTECDFCDSAPRNAAANRCSKERIRQNHVVDVLRSPSYLVASLFAWDRIADDAIAIHSGLA